MERKTALIQIAAVIVMASAGAGYAYSIIASNNGQDVDGHYLYITGLDASQTLDYDFTYDSSQGTAGRPLATSTLNDGSRLTYVAGTNVPGDYHLGLVSYSLHLDDGTVVRGTPAGTEDDLSKSTVVTRTDMKLTLDYLKITDGRIRFTLMGSAYSDAGVPVSTGSPAPALPARISTVDVTVGLTEGPAQDFSVEISSCRSVAAGDTSQSIATVRSGGIQVSGYTVNWTSGDVSVATVSDTGLVKGVSGSENKVAVTASLHPSFGTVSDTEKIYVVSASVQRYISIYAGESQTPAFSKLPSAASVSWTKVSGDTDISVDASTGLITVLNTAVGGDVAVVRADVSIDGATASELCLVSVLQPSVVLDKTVLNLSTGGTGTLTATVHPAGSTVVWGSSDTSVATVSSTGTVTAVASGTAVVAASITVDGKQYQATCVVTVS